MDRKNAYLNVLDNISWDTFYQEKMALQELTNYLHINSAEENGMFGRAAGWMEGILNMMDALGDAAESEGDFVYPCRDVDDLCFDERFNNVLTRIPEPDQ